MMYRREVVAAIALVVIAPLTGWLTVALLEAGVQPGVLLLWATAGMAIMVCWARRRHEGL